MKWDREARRKMASANGKRKPLSIIPSGMYVTPEHYAIVVLEAEKSAGISYSISETQAIKARYHTAIGLLGFACNDKTFVHRWSTILSTHPYGPASIKIVLADAQLCELLKKTVRALIAKYGNFPENETVANIMRSQLECLEGYWADEHQARRLERNMYFATQTPEPSYDPVMDDPETVDIPTASAGTNVIQFPIRPKPRAS